MPDPGLVVQVRSEDNSGDLGTLDLIACSAQVVNSDTGTITVEIPNDNLDGDPLAFPVARRILALSVRPDPTDLEAEPVALFRIERVTKTSISTDEKVGETTQIVGRGIGSDMEKWTVQQPGHIDTSGIWRPSTDVRRYDWATPVQDRTAWTPGVNRSLVSLRTTTEPEGRDGKPYNFANPLTYLLAPNAVSGPDPREPWYAHLDFPRETEERWLPNMAGSTQWEVAIDGAVVMSFKDESGDGMEDCHARPLLIPEGTHSIDLKVWNPDRPWAPTSSVCAFAISDIFTPAEEWLVTTNMVDFDWVCLAAGEEAPSFTPARPVIDAIEENQALGRGAGWSVSFTETEDSDGNTWPTGQFYFDVGMTVLDMLAQLKDAGWIEWGVKADELRIDMWVQGERGADKTATYVLENPPDDIEAAWLTTLAHEVDDSAVIGALELRSPEGWSKVGSGDRAQKLSLTDTEDRAESTRIATETLARLSTPQRSVTVGIDPPNPASVPLPATWFLGDAVTIPDETATPIGERLEALTYRLEDNKVTYIAEFVDLRTDKQTRMARVQKRMIDGSIGGRSSSAALVTKIQPAQIRLEDWSEAWSWSDAASSIPTSGLRGGPATLTKTTRIQRLELRCEDVSTSGTTTIALYADDVLATVGAVASIVGTQILDIVLMNSVFAAGTVLTALVTSRGSHPNGSFTVVGSRLPTQPGQNF